jgi:transcriptional regulator with XRE-family HTH domain
MKKDREPALAALGQQIRKIRLERGHSQEGFAAEVGLGRSYYGGVERGVHNIAAMSLMRIAVALKVEVGELFPEIETLEGLLERSSEAGRSEE